MDLISLFFNVMSPKEILFSIIGFFGGFFFMYLAYQMRSSKIGIIGMLGMVVFIFNSTITLTLFNMKMLNSWYANIGFYVVTGFSLLVFVISSLIVIFRRKYNKV